MKHIQKLNEIAASNTTKTLEPVHIVPADQGSAEDVLGFAAEEMAALTEVTAKKNRQALDAAISADEVLSIAQGDFDMGGAPSWDECVHTYDEVSEEELYPTENAPLKADVHKIIFKDGQPELVPDEEANARLDAMAAILRANPVLSKFAENPELRAKLLESGYELNEEEIKSVIKTAETLGIVHPLSEQSSESSQLDQLVASVGSTRVAVIPAVDQPADHQPVRGPVDVVVGTSRIRNPG